MSAENYHITSWVIIRSKVAVHNGTVFFEKQEADEVSFIKDLYRQLKTEYPKFYKMDNLCKLAFTAAELLLKTRTLGYKADEVALVFSNASASLDTDKTYYHSVGDKANYFPSPAVFVYTLPNIMMGEICIRHKLLGENTFFVSEKFDAELLAAYTENMLSSGKAKCVITGWIEINENEWEAALFLVEQGDKSVAGQRLSAETLDRIYATNRS